MIDFLGISIQIRFVCLKHLYFLFFGSVLTRHILITSLVFVVCVVRYFVMMILFWFFSNYQLFLNITKITFLVLLLLPMWNISFYDILLRQHKKTQVIYKSTIRKNWFDFLCGNFCKAHISSFFLRLVCLRKYTQGIFKQCQCTTYDIGIYMYYMYH